MRRCAPHGRSIGPVFLVSVQALLIACGEGADTRTQPAAREDTASAAAASNRAPVIEHVLLEPQSPVPGEPVRVVTEVRDADGDPVKMTYEWTVEGHSAGNGTSKLMLTGVERGAVVRAVVVASDGRADSEPATVSATLGNRPPRVERLRVAPSTRVTAGEWIEAHPEGRDPEGDALDFSYAWSVNGEAVGDATDFRFDTRQLARGDVVRVEVRADDGRDLSDPFASPEIHVTNRPPKVSFRPVTAGPGGGFAYTVVAEDPDGDAPLRFELEDAPEGMEIGSHSGEIRWHPRPDQAGRHRVHVIVDDLAGGRIDRVLEVEVGGDAPPAAVAP